MQLRTVHVQENELVVNWHSTLEVLQYDFGVLSNGFSNGSSVDDSGVDFRPGMGHLAFLVGVVVEEGVGDEIAQIALSDAADFVAGFQQDLR